MLVTDSFHGNEISNKNKPVKNDNVGQKLNNYHHNLQTAIHDSSKNDKIYLPIPSKIQKNTKEHGKLDLNLKQNDINNY